MIYLGRSFRRPQASGWEVPARHSAGASGAQQDALICFVRASPTESMISHADLLASSNGLCARRIALDSARRQFFQRRFVRLSGQ